MLGAITAVTMHWLQHRFERYDHGITWVAAVCGISLLMALMPATAEASVSCAVTAAGPVSVVGTVQNSTSIAPIPQISASSEITLNCTGDAGENFGAMQICSTYVGLPSQPPFAFTLERSDGRTAAGSLDNRLALHPLTSNLRPVGTAGTWAGNATGIAASAGVGVGVTNIPLLMDLEAPQGAIVESGTYTGTLQYTVKLIRLAGAPADDNCDGTYPIDQVIATTLSTPVTIVVPAQCTMTQPSVLDFGQQTSTTLSAGVSQISSSFRTICNNNVERFNVWIDGGESNLAGQRRLKRAGTNDFIPYDLLDRDNLPFPTTAIGNPEAQGKYIRNVVGVDVMINGTIPPLSDPAGPRAGFYTDRVMVHVDY